jgi:hypothetical protein
MIWNCKSRKLFHISLYKVQKEEINMVLTFCKIIYGLLIQNEICSGTNKLLRILAAIIGNPLSITFWSFVYTKFTAENELQLLNLC